MSLSILNCQKQYRGHAFDVSKVQIRLPDGRERFYDLVEHVDSVAIVPVDAQGNIYFVSQPRIGSGDTLLELPFKKQKREYFKMGRPLRRSFWHNPTSKAVSDSLTDLVSGMIQQCLRYVICQHGHMTGFAA